MSPLVEIADSSQELLKPYKTLSNCMNLEIFLPLLKINMFDCCYRKGFRGLIKMAYGVNL